MPMKTVDLLAGCGGFALGFRQAGFEVAAAFDPLPAAARCLRMNFSCPVFESDLSGEGAADEIARFHPGVLAGAPAGDGALARLAQIAAAVRPRIVALALPERAGKSRAYAEAARLFRSSGYGLTEAPLKASLCGSPQNARRLFCLGMLEEKDGFAGDLLAKGLASRPATLRDCLGGRLSFEFHYCHPQSGGRRAVFSVDEPAPVMRGVPHPAPENCRPRPGDAAPVHPGMHVLTLFERSLVCTFPETWAWTGTKAEIAQMLDAAVPPSMARHAAQALAEAAARADGRKLEGGGGE